MEKKKYNYKFKLVVTFALFNLLCVLLMSVTFYALSNYNLKKNYYLSIEGNLSEMIETSEEKTHYIEYIAKSFMMDKMFYVNLSKEYDTLSGSEILTSYFIPRLRSSVSSSPVDVNVSLYMENKTIPEHYYTGAGGSSTKRIFNINNIDRISQNDYYKKCMNNYAYMKWEQIDDDIRNNLISLVFKISSVYGDKSVGMFVIKASIDDIIKNSIPKTNGNEIYYKVLNEKGELLCQSDVEWNQKLNQSFNEEKITGVMDNGFTVEIYMPISNISKGKQQILWIIVTLSMLKYVINIIVGKKMTRGVYKDLADILSGIDQLKSGEYEYRFEIKGTDEFSQIEDALNVLASKISELIEDVYETMVQKQEIEYQMLRSKISPHFLYNVFNMVIQMAELGKDDEIIDLSMKTSYYYRKVLAKNKDLIKLNNEINELESYLEIVDVIKNRNVVREYHIDSFVKGCLVPSFLLQPIVENSILHAMIDGRIQIKINVRASDGLLIISIKDNGIGMNEAKVNNLFKVSTNGGYGLYNIMARIKLKFPGEKYGIFVSSKENKGTEVTLVLPIIDDEEGYYDL